MPTENEFVQEETWETKFPADTNVSFPSSDTAEALLTMANQVEGESDFYSLLEESFTENGKRHQREDSVDDDALDFDEDGVEVLEVEESETSKNANQKTEIQEDIQHLQVATIATKMRQFWVQLIDEQRSPTMSTKQPTGQPTKIELSPPMKAKLDRISSSPKNSPPSSPRPSSRLSTRSMSGILSIPRKNKDEKNLPREYSLRKLKEEKKNGKGDKKEEKKELVRRKSIFMRNRSASKLYTFKEKTLQRMNWEQIQEMEGDESQYAIKGTSGDYFLEVGNSHVKETNVFELEDTDKYEHYYRDHFVEKEHINYFGMTDKQHYGIITISQEEDETETGNVFFRSIIRTAEGDKRVDIVRQRSACEKGKVQQKILLKELKAAFSHLLYKARLFPVDNPKLVDDLVRFESRQVVQGVKIGVLLCKDGQTREEEMFSNQHSTPKFEQFLDFLGKRITLKGFDGFRGGLDINEDTTGVESVFTSLKDISVMFHVSTLLPFSSHDDQQLERKRHIGNDIVVIIFNESDQPFDVHTIKSEFNHVWAVVQPLEEGEDIRYRVAFAAKPGVPPFGPLLPSPPIFDPTPQFREYFLTKLLNAERAACSSPQFRSKLTRTRRELLKDLARTHLASKQLKKMS